MEDTLDTGRRLVTIQISKREEDLDPTRGYVNMPIGTKPFGVIRTVNGIALVALVPSKHGPVVGHALAMMPEDVLCIPLLGERIGDPIGVVQVGGAGGAVVAVAPILPWPEASVAGMETQGNG